MSESNENDQFAAPEPSRFDDPRLRLETPVEAYAPPAPQQDPIVAEDPMMPADPLLPSDPAAVATAPNDGSSQAVHPQMRELGHGSIINLSSIAWRGAAEMPAYSAAKAGILGLTHSLARLFGSDAIRVNAIEPGAVMTDRQRRLWYKTQGAVDAIVQRQSIKATLIGEDIARVALFLGAEDSRMITKQSITVDAGLR